MFFLPFETLTITTSLTASEVVDKLAKVVEPPSRGTWRYGQRNKPYRGTISEESFRIARAINYRNSFIPILNGKIIPQASGCTVKVRMRPHEFVIAFMAFWLWTTGSLGFLGLLAFVFNPEIGIGVIVPLGMFAFGCLLCVVPFKIEAGIAKDFLTELLRG